MGQLASLLLRPCLRRKADIKPGGSQHLTSRKSPTDRPRLQLLAPSSRVCCIVSCDCSSTAALALACALAQPSRICAQGCRPLLCCRLETAEAPVVQGAKVLEARQRLQRPLVRPPSLQLPGCQQGVSPRAIA